MTAVITIVIVTTTTVTSDECQTKIKVFQFPILGKLSRIWFIYRFQNASAHMSVSVGIKPTILIANKNSFIISAFFFLVFP